MTPTPTAIHHDRLVAGAAHGQISINPGTSLRYTPNRGYFGTDTFACTATDNR